MNRLIINVSPFETRVALLENQVVSELFIERQNEVGIVGNIYLGKVQRILPGMQAAFVDLGLDKAAFLYVDDIVVPRFRESVEPDEQEEILPVVQAVQNKPRIEDLLKQGQEILVQVAKGPIGTKGPRVTCQLSLPGRYVVFVPNSDHIGVSRQIGNEPERERLKTLLREMKAKEGGFIARTVSQGADDNQIRSDCQFLISLWRDIQKKRPGLTAPSLAQPELDLILRCIRDMANDQLDKIVVDHVASFHRVRQFFERFDAHSAQKIELFSRKEPIFEWHGIETELLKAMSRKVWLRSGGYLIFDQAEALTVVDVNTGKFVGKRNLNETILCTNLEATSEIAHQLRLRNIGGMVIIDFIDMEKQEDRDRVLQALNDSFKNDKARCHIVRMSELGLVEITRQRTRESLERTLCETCRYCEGKGAVRSKRTVVYDIFRSLMRKAYQVSEPGILVQAHPTVVELVEAEEKSTLSFLQNQLQKDIWFQPVTGFHQEQFDLLGVKTKPTQISVAKN